jgi:hypothetical protein
LLFCFAGLTLLGNASMLSGWQQFALLSATFTAMLVTAKLFSKSEAKQERQPKAGIPSVLNLQTNSLVQSEAAHPRVAPIERAIPASATSPVE